MLSLAAFMPGTGGEHTNPRAILSDNNSRLIAIVFVWDQTATGEIARVRRGENHGGEEREKKECEPEESLKNIDWRGDKHKMILGQGMAGRKF